MHNEIYQQQRESEFEQKAEAISKRIIGRHNQFTVTETPIEEMTEEEIKNLVEEGFNDYALNYILVGDFDNYIRDQRIYLNLSTRQPVRHINEVQEVLEYQLEKYISDLQKDCDLCKAKMYEYLCAYQDEQNRKKAGNPFSRE